MKDLVLFDSLDLSKASNENFYTTTEIIAERTGNSYDSVSRLVRRYKEKLEEIAPLN
ncbi:MAG: transcriptional regulator, partial [Lactococcus chungangensis]|nr:transcriptional regulator [Lactococcus chungangensis]